MELQLTEIPKDWGGKSQASQSQDVQQGRAYLYRQSGFWHAGTALLYSFGWMLTGWHCGPTRLENIDALYELPPCPEPRHQYVISDDESEDEEEEGSYLD